MQIRDRNYDFNDKIIPTAAYFQTRIIEDRLGVTILPTFEEETEIA